MAYDPDLHQRRSVRLKEYDYSEAGAYFVTVCVQDQACLFGHVGAEDDEAQVLLNGAGESIHAVW